MKTHDIAKSLTLLARILRESPNVELENYKMDRVRNNNIAPTEDLPTALMVIGALSKYTKDDWSHVIKEFDLDIIVKKTDSKRDLLGRFMNFMAANPGALKEFTRKAQSRPARTSKELSEALSILLK